MKGLVKKFVISGFIDNSDLDMKTAILTRKAELKVEQEQIVKFQVFDSGYFCDKSRFEDDGTQNYLVFQPFYKYF